MSAEGSLCDIVLYKEAFPTAEKLLPHKVLSYDTAPSTARKEDFICNIDSNLFRVAVLDIVDQYVDRKKIPCCHIDGREIFFYHDGNFCATIERSDNVKASSV